MHCYWEKMVYEAVKIWIGEEVIVPMEKYGV
jgi:hypothetical protein